MKNKVLELRLVAIKKAFAEADSRLTEVMAKLSTKNQASIAVDVLERNKSIPIMLIEINEALIDGRIERESVEKLYSEVGEFTVDVITLEMIVECI